MFRDIVVPLDGSALGERALDLADWIAGECDARLHLVRVHLSGPSQYAGEQEATRASDDRYLDLLASPRREGHRDVQVAVLDGSVALAISDYADRARADLIVMTTHGRTGDERRRLGSVAAVVAHHATCPVMLVRAGERTGNVPFEQIVIAVDGTEQPEAVTSMALRLASLGHPAFRIVHTLSPASSFEPVPAGVSTASPEHMKAESHVGGIANRLHAAGLRAEVLVAVTESPARAIGAAARQESADLVMLVTRLDAASPSLAPSLAEAMLHQWPSPVLLIKQF